MDTDSILLCSKVVRVAFISEVAKQLGLPLAHADLPKRSNIIGKPHLSLVEFGQNLGYPVVDSIIPLIEILDEGNSGTQTIETGIDNLDLLMDATKADFYDRLLNNSPPFQPTTSVEFGNTILNQEYEMFLKTSNFAGSVFKESEEVKEAQNLLFPKDENGNPKKSELYRSYESFAERHKEKTKELATARSAGNTNLVNTHEMSLERIQAEWINLGSKRDVENALNIIINADKEAGFEDERNHFINIFEARKKERISSDLSYSEVKIQPLSALSSLVNTDDNNQWTKVTLDSDQIKLHVDAKVQQSFGLLAENLPTLISKINSASFEYLVILLDREWLQQDFINARYWDHPDKLLSDGKGGGMLPTVASKIVFVREGKFKLNMGLQGRDSKDKSKNKAKLTMGKIESAPLLTMISASMKQPKKKNILSAKIKSNQINMITKASVSHVSNMKMMNLNKTKNKNKNTLHALSNLARNRVAITNFNFNPLGNAGRKVVLNIEVLIELEGVIPLDTILFTIEPMSKNKKIEEREIPFKKINSTTVKCVKNIRSIHDNSTVISQVHLRLRKRTKNGGVLLETKIPIGTVSSKKQIKWTLSNNEVTIDYFPGASLMAYALEIMPKSPNPDPQLHWE